jgi:type I restriction enzyme S subunit
MKMRENYKPLGKYIQPVDERNTALEELPLMGLSVSKAFFPTIANLVGTDMKTYKIVYRNQFTYIADTSRRGDKIAIALNDRFDKMLVSQAYTPFEVKDRNELDSEYLMMWFRRPEFDRYARFKSHGSAREIFDWEEMCNTLLPIPHIDKQREIVAEYNTIQNRIALNQQLIQKLEETAQAIYKEWFVEFEFPDENGNPYKSNGGEMVWCEELGKEIPKGWILTTLLDHTILSQGIQVEVDEQFLEQKDGMNRFLRIIDYTPNTEEPPRYVNIKDLRYYCSNDEISMIRYGDAGTVCRRFNGIIANNLFKITPKKSLTNNFLFYFLKDENIQRLIRTSAASSTMPAITHTAIKELPIIMPIISSIKNFDQITQLIENEILIKISENQKLTELKDLLLSRLATVA